MDFRDRLPMSIPALAAILTGLWISYLVLSTYVQYRKLRHIKGPTIAAISPLWLFYHTVRGDVYLAVADGLKKYGSPLRIGPNMVVTDDPTIQRIIAGPKSQWKRGHWFKGMKFDPRVDNVLSMTNESDHAKLRNKLIPGYTGKEVPSLEQDVDAGLTEFLGYINNYSTKGESLDFARAIAFFTLDILTQIAFGSKLGFMEKDEDVFNYLQSSQDFYPIMELGSNHPTIFNILKSPLMAGAQPKPTDRVGFGAIVGHAHKVVAERFVADAKPKHDMLGSFVRHGLRQEECESESLLQILAGADSTATALRTTFCHILTSPYVYSKLVKEINEAIEGGKASRPIIKLSEAQKMPYLQAVVKEGLRIFMPLQGLAGRVPPKGGADLNGVHIPEGTELGIATYAMLRREDMFGADADTFRPERWIDGDPKFIESMIKEHELIFGTGRSSCLGRSIALMELCKTIFEVLNAYDMTIVNAFRPMSSRSNSVVVQKNFWVRAYTRKA